MPRPAARPWLPEHRKNPFIYGLGHPPTFEEQCAILDARPRFAEVERGLPPHLRRYCVLRLKDYFRPIERQVNLVERVGMLIRQGYKHRNPATGQHSKAIIEAAERKEVEKSQLKHGKYVISNATGFALLGHPGMGKTTTMKRIEASFPLTIQPKLPYSVTQVPFLRVECPGTGSRKQFCISFFEQLGQRVGVDYAAMYGKAREVADKMILSVHVLAQIHALGVLVIDEIQHLNKSREGPHEMMNFLVTLVNTIGVPVIIVGTMAAMNLVQMDFREARRATEFGAPVWTRMMEDDPEWSEFIEDMWQYQWTSTHSELNEDVRHALYDESQGIVDIALKLFVCAQCRAIARGEVEGNDEVIDALLIRSVAAGEFIIIAPMIGALRKRKDDALIVYPDLRTFDMHVESYLAQVAGTPMERKPPIAVAGSGLLAAPSAVADPNAPAKAFLRAQGYGDDVIEKVFEEAVRRDVALDPFKTLEVVREFLATDKTARQKPKREKLVAAAPVALDLRRALDAPVGVHAFLVETGQICSVREALSI